MLRAICSRRGRGGKCSKISAGVGQNFAPAAQARQAFSKRSPSISSILPPPSRSRKISAHARIVISIWSSRGGFATCRTSVAAASRADCLNSQCGPSNVELRLGRGWGWIKTVCESERNFQRALAASSACSSSLLISCVIVIAVISVISIFPCR